jgi:hypothetical protein
MAWKDLKTGWSHTRMSASLRQVHLHTLREIVAGKVPSSELELVHAAVRSSIRLHTRVHWLDLRLLWRARELRPMVRRLPPLLFAPISSAGRRLGAVPSDAPQDPSLVVTWRRVLRVAAGA